MRIALISDIHGNRPALDAVLKSIDESGADEIWCLGDVTGYGADPDYCVETVLDRSSVCLAGNHDLVICGNLSMSEFSDAAAAAATWTRGVLSDEIAARLKDLKPSGVARDFGLYHASPRDPIWEYVLSIPQARACMAVQDKRVSFVGHSHVACFFHDDGTNDPGGGTASHELKLTIKEGKWLMNPGSVGQPRDGDPRASYLLLDTEDLTTTYYRIEYPVDVAAQAITDAGLPASLAQRLFLGY